MTYEEKLAEAVDIILENILTPIIYFYLDELAEFIVYSDGRALSDETLHSTEDLIYKNLGIKVEIVDMRQFDKADRSRIVMNADIAYTESDEMLELFENAMFEDLEMLVADKLFAIDRKTETGTYYLS